jgi:hypothetical protein
VPRDLADRLILELGSWLEAAEPRRVAAKSRAWDVTTSLGMRRLITAHGLAAVLVRDPAAAPATTALPDDLQAWLADQDRTNRTRIDRLQAELAAVLRAFARRGIPVMPLKGSLLWTRSPGDPYRRPMADLDLLVRPDDREAARSVLAGEGYRRREVRTRRPTHDTFTLPGNERVVSLAGEHPDNPRPIELHVEVKRHLWAWVEDDDLTPFLWARSGRSTVVGEPAVVPSDLALLGHLAVHATSDLLQGRGRLLQLLDLADVAATVAAGAATTAVSTAPGGDLHLRDLPHLRLVLPALVLATRRLPARTAAVTPDDIARLTAGAPARLAEWAARVPLDTHAGLQSGRILPGDVNTVGARWARWAPYPWRLLVAHGDVTLPVAAARHVLRVLRVAGRRPT